MHIALLVLHFYAEFSLWGLFALGLACTRSSNRLVLVFVFRAFWFGFYSDAVDNCRFRLAGLVTMTTYFFV